MMAGWTLAWKADVRRRLAVGLVAWLCGAMGVLWLWHEDIQAWDLLQDDVAQWQLRLQEAGSLVPREAAAPSDPGVLALPDPGERDALWSWLQQRLQAQGLQVLALKPQALTAKAGLPEQPLWLHLQGQWRDWRAFARTMGEHVPWWVVDQWQVVPANSARGEVRIELQARLGLRPSGLGPSPVARAWPVWPVANTDPLPGEALVFAHGAQGPAVAAAAPTSEAASALPADPRQWPVRELRLLGVWHQAGVGHAVLGAGQHQVVLVPGQRVGREAYRVRRVGPNGVELVAAAAPVVHLTLQGNKR